MLLKHVLVGSILLLSVSWLSACTHRPEPTGTAVAKRELEDPSPSTADRIMAQVTSQLETMPAQKPGVAQTRATDIWHSVMKPTSTDFDGLCRRDALRVTLNPVGTPMATPTAPDKGAGDTNTMMRASALAVSHLYTVNDPRDAKAWPVPDSKGGRTDCTAMPAAGVGIFDADDDETAAIGHWVAGRVQEALATQQTLHLRLHTGTCSRDYDRTGLSCMQRLVREVRTDRLIRVDSLDGVSRCAEGRPEGGSYRCYHLEFPQISLLAVVDLARARQGEGADSIWLDIRM